MSPRHAWLLGLALGCSNTDPDPDVDTDPDDDTDTLPAASFGGSAVKHSEVNRPNNLRMAVVHLVDGDGGALAFGPTIGSTPVSGTGEFNVILPAAGDPSHVGASSVGDASVALYLLVAHVDADLDEQLSADEVIAGVAVRYLGVWHDGTGTEPMGWGMATTDLHGDQELSFVDLSTRAEIDLWGLEGELRLSGYYQGALAAPLGMAGFDKQLLTGGHDGVMYDVPFNGDLWFEAHITLRPGAEFFVDDGVLPRHARIINRVFHDALADGDFTEDDTASDVDLCFEGRPMEARYVPLPTHLDAALRLDAARWTAGWRAYVIEGEVERELEKGQTRYVYWDDECVVTGG